MIFFKTLLAFVFINKYIMLIMSMIKKKKWILYLFVTVALCLQPCVAQEETNDIINYYAGRAKEVYASRNPYLSGLIFSFDTRTYKKLYDDDSKLFISDSTLSTYYVSFEHVDSIVVKVPPKHEMDSLDFQYPNIFAQDYVYNFFPNDTGGKEISIGFDAKEYSPRVPVGIAVLNREYYYLTKLHLHFMHEIRIERASRSYRFTEIDGYVFPDSVWEVKSRSGIFSTEYYRLETGITDINIQR